MAFCSQCGALLPENGKFCPNCGASINADMPADVPLTAEVADDLIPVVPPAPVQQQITGEITDTSTKKKKPRRTIGTLFSLASFVLAILALLSGSLVLSIVFAVAAIAAGVFAFIKKGRLKALAIIAFLIAAFAFVDTVWYIATGEIMLAPSGTVETDHQTAAGGKAHSAGIGVDPDLAAFLNSYESFVDEYVAFMQNYMADPTNVVSMLGDYLEMAEKLEDFSEQADRYDTDDMSTADAKYYLEVMTRCEMKMLDVLG